MLDPPPPAKTNPNNSPNPISMINKEKPSTKKKSAKEKKKNEHIVQEKPIPVLRSVKLPCRFFSCKQGRVRKLR